VLDEHKRYIEIGSAQTRGWYFVTPTVSFYLTIVYFRQAPTDKRQRSEDAKKIENGRSILFFADRGRARGLNHY
jgi:hypothetical protein